MTSKISPIPIPQQIIELIEHGKEERYLEYKDYSSWNNDEKSKFNIIRAILAMANNKDGGTIVIGMKDNGSFATLSEDNALSYKHDDISKCVKNHADPMVEFTVQSVFHESSWFVIIQIKESKECVICAENGLANKGVPSHGDNLILRKNAIYLRRSNPVESAEANTHYELRERIERVMELNKENLRRDFSMYFLNRAETVLSDNTNFNDRLTQDKLM